jgi:hypothetical protein
MGNLPEAVRRGGATGATSLHPIMNGTVLERTNRAEYPVAGARAAFTHEDRPYFGHVSIARSARMAPEMISGISRPQAADLIADGASAPLTGVRRHTSGTWR